MSRVKAVAGNGAGARAGHESGSSAPVGGREVRALRRAGVGGAAVLAASSLFAISAAATATGAATGAGTATGLAAVTAAPRVAPRDTYLGAIATSTELTGSIVLSPRDPAKLADFVAEVSDPHSSLYRDYLPRGAFVGAYGPTSATIAAVTSTLRREGLTVTGVSADGLFVRFSGTAARIGSAFHTGLSRYRLTDGTIGYATTSAIELPRSIAGSVTAVVGLDDLVRYHDDLVRTPHAGARHAVAHAPLPAASPGAPSACPDAIAQEAESGITDDEVAHSYGVDGLYASGDLGQGESVDIFELEPYLRSDIKAFDECYFGADHTSQISNVTIGGGAGIGEGSGEAVLDIENVSAIAPDTHINVYEAPNSTIGTLDDYQAMIDADNSNVISTSWGLCEAALQISAPGSQAVENSLFMQAAAQGETVYAAAGDDGSDDCAEQAPVPVSPILSVDDPESQPYVVSAGGTSFLSTAEPPDEIVWNDGNFGGAGGGGISSTWAMPAWQLDSGVAGVADNPYITTAASQFCSNDPGGSADEAHAAGFPTTLAAGTYCREVPDVTALADEFTGITVYDAEYGGWTTFGGTSSSAPLWAAMTADIDASSFCSSSPHGVGFISPVLYEVAATPADYADAFNDVTVGDNDSVGDVGDLYPAGPGYDLASGLGSPRLTNPSGTPGLAALACGVAVAPTRPSVSGLGTLYGPVAGGTPVTITGARFGATAGSVQFGNVRATVTSWAPTSITVSTPAFYAAEGTSSPAGGSAQVTVETAATPSLSSAPGADSVFHYLAGTSGSPLPLVEYVGPSSGPLTGGTAVNILGSGFEDGTVTGVSFGGTPATGVTVVSDSELTVTTPANPGTSCVTGSVGSQGACQVQVVVTTTKGSSPTSTILPAYQGPISIGPLEVFVPPANCSCEVAPAPTEFDYAPPPSISSVSPPYGSASGGTIETITGAGFNLLTYEWTDFGAAADESSQDFNDVAISPVSVQVVDPESQSAVAANRLPATVSVQTSTGLGSYTGFAFAGVPVVDGLSSSYGPTTGGQSLTITGDGFKDATQVDFVSQFQPDVFTASVVYLSTPPSSDSTLTIETPADLPVATDVLVCSVTACDSAEPSVDTYVFDYPGQPVVTSSGPAAGPAKGGEVVTINGSLLTGVRAVYFGTQLAEGWSNGPGFLPSGSSTQIFATSPPGQAGTKVEITVDTFGSSEASPPTPVAEFTYAASAPSAPVPLHVAAEGGAAALAWSAPATDGGDAVTGYQTTASSPGRASVGATLPATARSYTFAYLQPGVPWTFTVRALSALGAGVPTTSAAYVIPAGDNGYLIATTNGGVFGFGSLAASAGVSSGLVSEIVGIAATPDGLGYWVLDANGHVYNFGDAPGFQQVSAPSGASMVGIAATPDGGGYWLVASDGAVFGLGDAPYHGGLSGVSDVVGITSTPDGGGYYLAQADGAVATYGDGVFRGDMSGTTLTKPIVGIATDPLTGGYWLVGGDGGVFSFGARYEGSMEGRHLNAGAVGMVGTPDGLGYWLVASDGGVFAFGDGRYAGNPMASATGPSIGVAD